MGGGRGGTGGLGWATTGIPANFYSLAGYLDLQGAFNLGVIIFGASADFYRENSMNFLEEHLQVIPKRPQMPPRSKPVPLWEKTSAGQVKGTHRALMGPRATSRYLDKHQ